jgi:hypothetical protein
MSFGRFRGIDKRGLWVAMNDKRNLSVYIYALEATTS